MQWFSGWMVKPFVSSPNRRERHRHSPEAAEPLRPEFDFGTVPSHLDPRAPGSYPLAHRLVDVLFRLLLFATVGPFLVLVVYFIVTALVGLFV